MTETSRAFRYARRPAAARRAEAALLVLLLAAAIGGQVVAASRVALAAPWTRIRHTLLTSNDWVLAIPDDRTASGMGKPGHRSKAAWTAELGDVPPGSAPSCPDGCDLKRLAGQPFVSPPWPAPSAPRGPPDLSR